MSSERSLRHGVTDQLIAAATASGHKLSAREIQRRLQCARSDPTEAEIRHVVSDFETWHDLVDANFPAYEAPPDEPPADHRTKTEREHDRARALLDLIGEQAALFPLSDFEPVTTTLKEMEAHTVEMEELTARFAERDAKRRAYLDSLIAAADGDLSMTWQDAQDRLNASDSDAYDETSDDPGESAA
jgi:hypothetical protein